MGWGDIAKGLIGGDSNRQDRSSDPRSMQMARVNRASRINRGVATTGKNVKSSLDGRGSSGEIAKQKENRGKQDWVEQSFGRPGKTAGAKANSKPSPKKTKGAGWNKNNWKASEWDHGGASLPNVRGEIADMGRAFGGGVKHGYDQVSSGVGHANKFMIDNEIGTKAPGDAFVDAVSGLHKTVNSDPISYDKDTGYDIEWENNLEKLLLASSVLGGPKTSVASNSFKPVAQGLLGPGARRMGPIKVAAEDIVPAPVQQTRNVYTGPAGPRGVNGAYQSRHMATPNQNPYTGRFPAGPRGPGRGQAFKGDSIQARLNEEYRRMMENEMASQGPYGDYESFTPPYPQGTMFD